MTFCFSDFFLNDLIYASFIRDRAFLSTDSSSPLFPSLSVEIAATGTGILSWEPGDHGALLKEF
jgi:hypothetical protein